METALTFRNHHLRNLAWSIGSAPLLLPGDQDARWLDKCWFQRRYHEYLPVLEALDRNPTDLLQWLETANQRRLGSYFESLWLYWLKTNQRFLLLQANLAVRDAGRTLGEFDLLVEDTHTGRQLHWELALKFYLGTGNTRLMQNWCGPMKRDRLDHKYRHMQTHQCRLSQLPAAKQQLAERDIVVDEVWSIVKGRLFYPLRDAVRQAPGGAADSHLAGWWQAATAFYDSHTTNVAVQYCWLDKSRWLAPVSPQAATLNSEMSCVGRPGRVACDRPVMVAVCADGLETSRGFIVPDAWPERQPE